MSATQLIDCFGLCSMIRGRAGLGLLSLAIATITLCLGAPTRASAQPARGKLVGTWNSTLVVPGSPPSTCVMTYRADGTFRGTAVCGDAVVCSTGKYTYANGTLRLVHNNGIVEENAVEWVNGNRIIVTCRRSNFSVAAGLELICNRQR
jgi:hypothetical protein